MKTITKLFTVILALAFVSCSSDDERPCPDTEALIGRQLIIDQFGPDVWESTTNYNTFLARCPDNSVWLVVIERPHTGGLHSPDTPTRIKAKTMIFNGTVPLPTEKHEQ